MTRKEKNRKEKHKNMELLYVREKKDQKRFLAFRKNLYRSNKVFVDNNYFLLQEFFAGKTSFVNGKEIFTILVLDEGKVICEGIIIYTKELPEYIQLCFLECLPEKFEAVKLLVDEAVKLGKERNCIKMVVGLNGHVNYGLGLLNSHFDEVNSFSASANPEYYNVYLKELGFDEVKMNTYIIENLDQQLERYRKLIDRLNRKYTFKPFDKKQFDYYAKIYTDLNNQTFTEHRYYYKREYIEDKEMLKELFLFMKEDSLIFAFEGDKPVGFILWYPDFNELAKPGEAFGAKHFIKNKFQGKKIKTAKIMEFGILEEKRQYGLPLGLVNQVAEILKKYGIKRVESSWVLDENKDSNSVCEALCDGRYKDYVSYEKSI